jgi:hypothetical protein
MAIRRHRRLLLALLGYCCSIYPAKSFSVIQHPLDLCCRPQSQLSRKCTLKVSSASQQHPQYSSPEQSPCYRRIPQVRQKPRNRKPKNYWSHLENVELELRDLWESMNVTLDDDGNNNQPPPIPNESLLNYWKRYDLRAAIVTHGGREVLAEALGGSAVIPGRWAVAVNTTHVQQVLENDPGLSPDFSPLSPQQLKKGVERDFSSLKEDNRQEKRRSKKSSRKEKGYWSSDIIVIQELYVETKVVMLGGKGARLPCALTQHIPLFPSLTYYIDLNI